ncbi:hypothetical protein TNO020_40098 [Tenacibaculum piscium]|uniref:Uncharacterized protein n=2 Tax=Flavobacteriaceae TaxID=49546 RepID=A0A2H1YHA2_9FLAO|nr:hypothetical protein TNO020_40098 [Tenacibaculum piscium]
MVIIMYTTAIYAQSKATHDNNNYGEKATANELVSNFNEGKHIVCDADNLKTYSILL